jgi:hypothetical protein
MRIPTSALLALALSTATATAVVGGCKRSAPPPKEHGAENHEGPPTVRLYLSSTVAGALEPCGCSKDQLGGLDHLAAFMTTQKKEAPRQLFLAAGPLLYLDPELNATHATQDRWKAETIAAAMKHMGLVAWSPGRNDWAGGGASLTIEAERAGASLLAQGLAAVGEGARLFEVEGLKVGVVGVSDPKNRMGSYPEGVEAPGGSPHERVKKAVESLKAQGAQLFVTLAALPRGDALRIADAVPELHVLVVGKPVSEGHQNTAQPPPEMIGRTLVVETANHAQTVSIVDIYVEPGAGDLVLADAGGVERGAKLAELSARIRDLESRINSWEKGGKVDPKDLSARKKDLARLRQDKRTLEAEPPAPSGSYFRYRVEEVREGLGVDPKIADQMRAYYKRVNEHNKTALADLKPPPVSEGQAGYVGIEECTTCHQEEREVWDATAHARAYATLVDGFKEYNLECVGCHVTGYGKPGGSTVTHNELLRDVQCETCHGPGSLHAKNPDKPGLVTRKPDPRSCVEQCHHPPHVDGFDPVTKMDLVLGPGHGK